MDHQHLRSRSPLVLTALLFGLLANEGCKKKEAPVVETTSAPVPSFVVGDKVDVKWNGSWWKGEVLSVDGPKYRVHYTGWSSNWDEGVTADRLRALTSESKVGTSAEAPGAAPTASAPDTATAASAAAPASASAKVAVAGAFKAGDKVDVNWKGKWYQAQVLSVSGTSYRVHYLGWASSWDESVPPTRMRAWTGSASRGSGPN